jgi:hypothetical protein
MEAKTVKQVIEEAKKIRFADPVNKKSWDVYRVNFIIDDEFNVNGPVKYTTWVNLDPTIKNSYLKNAFIISAWTWTKDDILLKKYLH